MCICILSSLFSNKKIKCDENTFRKGIACIIIDESNKLLVFKRRGYDTYQFPQGGIENDEDHVLALKRELFEETGIKDIEIISETNGQIYYRFPKKIRIKHGEKYKGQCHKYYLCNLTGDLNFKESDEFSDHCWMNPKEFLKQTIPFKKNAYEKAMMYFKLL